MPLPGKSGREDDVYAAIAGDLAWEFASFEGFVRKTATSRGIEHTRESLQAIGENLEASDPVKFCRAVLDDAGWHPGESAVVDGVGHIRIWETLKNIVAPQPIYMVYLEAPEELDGVGSRNVARKRQTIWQRQRRTPPNGT